MTPRHFNYPVDESTQNRPAEDADGRVDRAPTPRAEMRPEIRRIFEARWKRNEAGYRYLAGR